jgi:D-amino-acid oxidase
VSERTTLSRRDLLAAAGAAATLSLGGCTRTVPAPSPAVRYQRPLSRRPFVAPRVSMDRVIRVIAGLRPYRPSGFVVRREAFDDKTVIHNYGHGGGGISLSWGSSALAVREASGLAAGRAAVLGAGIMGLTTSRLLQDSGWQVTIYTRSMPRHSTSNVGAGQWGPTSVFEEGIATAAFKARYREAARISHHAFQNMIGPRYGVSFLENYYLGDEPHVSSYYERELPELFTAIADLGPEAHPFPSPYVHRVVTMMIQPAVFLRQVRDDFLLAGGRVAIRHFASVEQVLSLDEPVVFNCTGLGAAALFGDDELQPAKGQLVFVLPDPAVDFATIGAGRGVTYMFPRTGELVLGGSWDRGNWDRTPDPDITERIVEDHRALFDAMR